MLKTALVLFTSAVFLFAFSNTSAAQPKPRHLTQIAGNLGTVDLQAFDTWVIAYTYPTEDHKLLGIASRGRIYTNTGTRTNPKLGEMLGEAELVRPKSFDRSRLNYPVSPPELEVEERHVKHGKTLYVGRLIFRPSGELSRRSSQKAIQGRPLGDYLWSWPMYNYVIDQRMRQGEVKAFVIELNPE